MSNLLKKCLQSLLKTSTVLSRSKTHFNSSQSVSNLAIQFGDSDSDGSALSRPFGVALLFAGSDPDHGPQLFHMDPSGTYVRYDAKAIGSGSEGESRWGQV